MSEENAAALCEVSKLFLRCLNDLQRTSKQDWQSLDLTMAQLKVLVTLGLDGAVAISHLAEALGITQPTASHLVERLVQAGLAERVEDPTDRRYTLAHLTESGMTIARRLWQGRLEYLQSRLAQLHPQDLAALQQGLDALNHVEPSVSSTLAVGLCPLDGHPPDEKNKE